MTILAPSVAARHVEPPTSTTRQYIRYLFHKVRPTWRLASPVLRAYSTLGTRGNVDFLLWKVSERLGDFQELQAAVLNTSMGAHEPAAFEVAV
jgi:chlorite dismutase